MPELRKLITVLEDNGELLRISRPVDPQFELPALLKQAEACNRAVLFESVKGSACPAVGGLLTDAGRFARGLGLEGEAGFSRDAHRELIEQAIAAPLAAHAVGHAAHRELVQRGSEVRCDELPVPTCFAGDSGPFLTAAVGISRNPDNGVINAGIYRVLMLDSGHVAVSVGPSSDLLRFLAADRAAGRTTEMALVIGGDPALLMAAAAKVTADVSELDVARALEGRALEYVAGLTVNLPVPASAEIVLELVIRHEEQTPNTMGEFGDLYGTQTGHVATVTALSRRRDAIFHTIMAGAGREHNSLGFIILYAIEPGLRAYLAEHHPDIAGCRVAFDPPAMGMPGEIYLQLSDGRGADAEALCREIFALQIDRWDIARVIRRIVLVDTDIDIHSARELTWAVNNRVEQSADYLFFEDLPLPGLGLRAAIDARMRPADRERLQRLRIPGEQAIRLDDYL